MAERLVGYIAELRRSPKGGKIGQPLGQTEQQRLLQEFAKARRVSIVRTYTDFSLSGTCDLLNFKQAVKACHRLRAKLVIADLATVLAYIPLNVEVSKLTKAPLEPTPYRDALEHLQERYPLPLMEVQAALTDANNRDRRYNYKRRWRAGFPDYPVTDGFIINPETPDQPLSLSDKYVLLMLAMARHFKLIGYNQRRWRVKTALAETTEPAGLAAPSRCYSHLEAGTLEYEARRQADELRRRRAAVALGSKADRRARNIEEEIKEITADGHTSLRAIARELASRTNGEVSIPHTSVRNYLKRLGLR